MLPSPLTTFLLPQSGFRTERAREMERENRCETLGHLKLPHREPGSMETLKVKV